MFLKQERPEMEDFKIRRRKIGSKKNYFEENIGKKSFLNIFLHILLFQSILRILHAP